MTKEQRDRFADELGYSGNLAFACRAAGVTREDAVAERDRDRAFEALWRQASSLADVRAKRRIRTA